MSVVSRLVPNLVLAAIAVTPHARADTVRAPTAGTPTVSVASFADEVQLPPNAGGLAWHKISDGTTAAGHVQEYVPVPETGALWSQIITVKTLPVDRDPKQIVDGTVTLMREICGRIKITNVAHSQRTGEVGGLGVSLPIYDETDELVTCKEPNITKLREKIGSDKVTLRRYEVTWYKLIKGSRANYIVQRAWHGDAIDGTCLLGSDAVLDEWKSWITHVTLVRRDIGPRALQ
jgi:hypothetical protein